MFEVKKCIRNSVFRYTKHAQRFECNLKTIQVVYISKTNLRSAYKYLACDIFIMQIIFLYQYFKWQNSWSTIFYFILEDCKLVVNIVCCVVFLEISEDSQFKTTMTIDEVRYNQSNTNWMPFRVSMYTFLKPISVILLVFGCDI
jgi:hypothetical protein